MCINKHYELLKRNDNEARRTILYVMYTHIIIVLCIHGHDRDVYNNMIIRGRVKNVHLIND